MLSVYPSTVFGGGEADESVGCEGAADLPPQRGEVRLQDEPLRAAGGGFPLHEGVTAREEQDGGLPVELPNPLAQLPARPVREVNVEQEQIGDYLLDADP